MTEGEIPAVETSEGESDRPLNQLVTIGVPLGIMPNVEMGKPVGLLRHGRDLLELDVDTYKVLFRARETVLRSNLVRWATSHQHIADPEAIIDRCLADGTLRDIDFRSDQSLHHWPELRLQAVGMGLGPNAEGHWRIEVPQRGVITIDPGSYFLWAASDGRSVREVSDTLADEVGDRRDAAAVVLAVMVLRLVSDGAAFLDKVP
jgi:hypothetical protein